jgi:hypothetical protein
VNNGRVTGLLDTFFFVVKALSVALLKGNLVYLDPPKKCYLFVVNFREMPPALQGEHRALKYMMSSFSLCFGLFWLPLILILLNPDPIRTRIL